jgi:hypothetical protein
MGAVGSVGVVVLHTEDSKFNDEQGSSTPTSSKATGRSMGALQSIAKRRLMLDIPFSRPLAGIGHRVPFGRKKRAVEMPGLWKAWKAKNRLPTLSRRERRIYRTPARLADEQIGICTPCTAYTSARGQSALRRCRGCPLFPWRSRGLPTYSPCRCRRFPTNRGSGLGCRRREACWCPRRRPKGYGWSRSSERGLPTVALVAAQPILSKLDYH